MLTIREIRTAARVYQARADSVFEKWGFRAPAPVIGEDPEDYRRDLCVKAKRQLPYDHELRKIKLWQMPKDVFEVFEPQVYDACAEAAKRPDSVPPGEMRMLKTKDQNGQEIITWIGNESFVKDMGRPGRRVVSFMHRFNTSGVAFR
jgi:hypothetical protein